MFHLTKKKRYTAPGKELIFMKTCLLYQHKTCSLVLNSLNICHVEFVLFQLLKQNNVYHICLIILQNQMKVVVVISIEAYSFHWPKRKWTKGTRHPSSIPVLISPSFFSSAAESIPLYLHKLRYFFPKLLFLCDQQRYCEFKIQLPKQT